MKNLSGCDKGCAIPEILRFAQDDRLEYGLVRFGWEALKKNYPPELIRTYQNSSEPIKEFKEFKEISEIKESEDGQKKLPKLLKLPKGSAKVCTLTKLRTHCLAHNSLNLKTYYSVVIFNFLL